MLLFVLLVIIKGKALFCDVALFMSVVVIDVGISDILQMGCLKCNLSGIKKQFAIPLEKYFSVSVPICANYEFMGKNLVLNVALCEMFANYECGSF